ncbi:lantibiotic dehydratase [Frankia sp. CNm7]|uniref:Lantibiotic dehydratase n=1 Tax=Frankia nepalensis TaxID=1836974 RepID=A0A937REN4_9ACTN|nr:lantibiotic dehydratase [Frankia nepalensis]MBL7499875.1 lantibiotic dehydratase [Frankia nepalensis]MBL7512307.1 lantibiotic dehydratase [Frankia nepalensis]MBL7516970.1 lantibiotic dehydratase [Frankia nepalensis]MBL7629015.1 lantibiotic dehydratase [Frankia nepalensis]
MDVRYRAMGVAVVRAVARDSGPGPDDWPDLAGHGPEQVGQWHAWLRRQWDDDELAEAIETASPALAAAVRQICSGKLEEPRRLRRVAESVMSYRLRMTSRPTPFGLFAGVLPAALGTQARVRWDGARAVARPDGRWLAELVTTLEAEPDVLRTVPVVANTVAFVRGDRLVLPSQPRVDDDGTVTPSDIEVRHSRPVQVVLRAARSPVPVADLIARLAAEFSGTPEPVLEAMLTRLVATGVLVTALRPPMDVTDPLGHLADQLRAASSDSGQPARERLELASRTLDQLGRSQSAPDRRALAEAASTQLAALHDRPGPLLAVDLRLGGKITLPGSIEIEAAAAASVLVQLSPNPLGSPAWQAWHGQFVDRYGPGAVIPVTEAVDVDRGLGYPAGYRGTPHPRPPRAHDARDDMLLRLAQRALLDGTDEVVLDDEIVKELTAAGVGAARQKPHAVPHTELRFRVHAPTLDAVDRGAFTLVVTGASRQAGTSIGRFLYLLDAGERDQIEPMFTDLPTMNADALAVQLSCAPLSPRAQNLVRAPALLPLLSLGEHPASRDSKPITVDDLAIVGDTHRLCLVQMSSGQVVEPLAPNALEFRHATHPLARFLCEITTARAASCVPFSWGAAAGQPVLPRVRYGRSVLRSASWNLCSDDLPRRAAPAAEWEKAFESLRHTYRIPSSVYAGEADVVLRLDLDQPAHRALLRTQLDRSRAVPLTEGPPENAFGWIGGRPHEITLPLGRVSPPFPLAPVLRRGRPLRPSRHAGHLPGASRWLYARLHGHPARQTELLTIHLPDLVATWPGTAPSQKPPLWFLRYDNGAPHLRLRIHLGDEADAYGAAARHVGAWAGRLRAVGLLGGFLLDTYEPEVGRYGIGPALEAAEAVFAADSTVAIAQLTATKTPSGPAPSAITAASLVDLAAGFLGAADRGWRWLLDNVAHQGGPALDRDLRTQTLRLLEVQSARQRDPSSEDSVARAWAQRHETLDAYRHLLDDPDAAADGPDPDRVLASLLHLHHARMIGTYTDSEQTCLRLARAAALTLTTRAR